MRFGTSVEKMWKSGDYWHIRSKENVEWISRNVIVCSGVHQKPNRTLESTLFKDFKVIF